MPIIGRLFKGTAKAPFVFSAPVLPADDARRLVDALRKFSLAGFGIILCCFAPVSPAIADNCDNVLADYNTKRNAFDAKNAEWTRKYGDWRNPSDMQAACDAVTWYLNNYLPFLIEGTKKVESACSSGRLFNAQTGGSIRGSDYWVAFEPKSRKFQTEWCKNRHPSPETVAVPLSPPVQTTTPAGPGSTQARLSHPSSSASCSDITGTNSKEPAAETCARAQDAACGARRSQ